MGVGFGDVRGPDEMSRISSSYVAKLGAEDAAWRGVANTFGANSMPKNLPVGTEGHSPGTNHAHRKCRWIVNVKLRFDDDFEPQREVKHYSL